MGVCIMMIMAYLTLTNRPCVGCAEPTRRRARSDNAPLCETCGHVRMLRNAKLLYDTRGKGSPAWREGMMRAAQERPQRNED